MTSRPHAKSRTRALRPVPIFTMWRPHFTFVGVSSTTGTTRPSMKTRCPCAYAGSVTSEESAGTGGGASASTETVGSDAGAGGGEDGRWRGRSGRGFGGRGRGRAAAARCPRPGPRTWRRRRRPSCGAIGTRPRARAASTVGRSEVAATSGRNRPPHRLPSAASENRGRAGGAGIYGVGGCGSMCDRVGPSTTGCTLAHQSREARTDDAPGLTWKSEYSAGSMTQRGWHLTGADEAESLAGAGAPPLSSLPLSWASASEPGRREATPTDASRRG